MSFLPGSMDRREALALLSAAYESGIRHFDTAPLYGWGAAEDLLGTFAAGKTDLTIITKAGIAAPSMAARLIAKAPGTPAARASFSQFNPSQVTRSLENSLSRLRLERVDALLLHEPAGKEVTEELVEELIALKRDGKTDAIGLATSAAHSVIVLERFPDIFDIVQIPIADANLIGRERFTVLHSVLGARLRAVSNRLAHDIDLARKLNADDRDALAQNLLRAALAESGGGVVLFSTTRIEAIRVNAQLKPADPALLEHIQALFETAAQLPQPTATA